MKTELEKMLDGDLYDASDATLVTMRFDARKLFADYNRTDPYAEILRRSILDQLLGAAATHPCTIPPEYPAYGVIRP